jgi:hypothetical protein
MYNIFKNFILMEDHLNTSKTFSLVKIRASFETIKIPYYEMVKVFKIRFSNMSSLNNKI